MDLLLASSFLTRLPMPSPASPARDDLQRALRVYPVIGLTIGLTGALAFWLGAALGLGAWPAALLAVTVTIALTGALHEDGLADTLDGFGGGGDRARKLAIMRDSRLGSFGALALILSVSLRSAALAALADPGLVARAMIAAHSTSRALFPGMLAALPFARTDGLASAVGTPPSSVVATALVLGTVIAVLSLGLVKGLSVVAIAFLVRLIMGLLAKRQVGGITGDILGATQQTAETAALLAVVALQ